MNDEPCLPATDTKLYKTACCDRGHANPKSHRDRPGLITSLALAVLVFLAAVSPGFAQVRTTGEIRGTVSDSSGALVPNVHITAVETATQFTKTAISDGTGTYLLSYLPPGNYSVSFELTGFKTAKRDGLAVHAGDVIQINVPLQVGSMDQSVTVNANAAALELESAARSTRLTTQAIIELPNVGRNNQQIFLITPGASYGAQRANGGGPGGDRVSIAGQRTYTTNFSVDGGAGTFAQSFNADNIKPALDSTEEVTVNTNNFNAEYGNGGAVFSVISKSGTNQFHGTLYEFNQNDKLGARNFFATSKTPVRWNQFGGNLGGPILKNKMFFFFTYEGLRSSSPSATISTVPTQPMLAGDFSAPGLPTIYDPLTTTTVDGLTSRTPFAGNRIPTDRIDPVALAAASYWPSPNRAGFSNNYYYASGSTTVQDLISTKWDYNVSSDNRLSLSVMHVGVDSSNMGSYPGAACNCSQTDKKEWQVPLTDVWTISPTLLNELRLSFLREEVPQSPSPLTSDVVSQIGLKNVPVSTFPNFSISGFVTTSLTAPSGFNLRQNSYVPADTVTWTKGRHIVKLGFEMQKLQVNNVQPWYTSGNFSFTGTFTNNPAARSNSVGLADYFLGLPQTYSLTPAPSIGERLWTVQSFIQDDFKIRPNLTLSAGIRYHARSGWSEAHNQLSGFDPGLINPATGTPGAIWYAGQNGTNELTDGKANLFAPRLGLAWSPIAKISIRAAYGIFYVPLSADTYSNQNPAGFSINQSLTSTDLVTPIFSLDDGPPAYAYPDASNRTPDALNGQSVGYWPRKMKEPYTQQWHLTMQRELSSTSILELAYVGTKGTHLVFPRDINQVPASELGPGNAQLLRPYPQYQGITGRMDDGDSTYHALQINFRKVAGHGLTLMASYAYSKMIDNSSYDHTTGVGNIWQIAGRPDLNRALSQLDVPQTVSGAFVYELPVGKGRAWLSQGGMLSTILGGWQTSGIFRAESGIPFTVTMSGTNGSNSLAGTWLPNRLGKGTVTDDQQSINHWFDYSAFEAPALYTFGNSGRDILRGPGFWNLDFALAKNFGLPQLGERGRLQFRADFSNFFNHPNFNLPNAAIGSSAVGTITTATSPRNIQLGLKLNF